LPACRFSRPVHSTALPPFRDPRRLVHRRGSDDEANRGVLRSIIALAHADHRGLGRRHRRPRVTAGCYPPEPARMPFFPMAARDAVVLPAVCWCSYRRSCLWLLNSFTTGYCSPRLRAHRTTLRPCLSGDPARGYRRVGNCRHHLRASRALLGDCEDDARCGRTLATRCACVAPRNGARAM
jgi:hypothetical protein